MRAPLKTRLFLPAIALLLFVAFPGSSTGQYRFLENGNPLHRGSDSGFLLDTPTRLKIDLSGEWSYSVEDGPSGIVEVPSAYDGVGKVAFERTFEVTQGQLDTNQFQLVMFGVNQGCEVYLNGEFLLNHSGGYTSFLQQVPSRLLQPGKDNHIRVVVTNELDPKRTLLMHPQILGWRDYGGILRDIFLLATPKLYIKDAVTTTGLSENFSQARISVRAEIAGEALPSPSDKKPTVLGLYVEVLDKISGVSLAHSPVVPLTRGTEDWNEVRAELTVPGPKLWSPATPDLELVKCFIVQTHARDVAVIDEYDQTCGIRTLAVQNGDLLLNGKRLILKGVVWNEFDPGTGSAIRYEQQERDMVLIKNLGANLVRFGGHPPHPYMLDLCDRYGMLAMEELPVCNTPARVLGEEAYVELAGAMMREMVVRDRNHPSVLAWGIGDEFESSGPQARSFVESVLRVQRSLDSRPSYFGARLMTADTCSDLVDLAAVNVHTQDLKTFKAELEWWRSRHRRQPVIVAGFGTEVQPDNHNGYSDPFSQEAQARFYLQRFEILRSLDYDGGVVWSFNDWMGGQPSLSVHSGDPWMHTMGLVNVWREKRLAYDAVRSIFNGEKFIALPMGNHSASAPIIYVLSGLVVLIGMAYFYNASRRFRENVNRSLLNSYNFFADVRDHHSVSIVHTTLLGIVVSLALAIVLSSVFLHFRDNWILDNLLSVILVSDSAKVAFVRLIWDPLKFIAYATGGCFLLLLVLTSAVLMLRPFVRTRIFPGHGYAVTMWATPPLLILVPVGMILYRVMESPVYVGPVLAGLLLLLAWVMLRLLKGISIIYDIFPIKVYMLAFVAMVVVLGAAYVYYDYTQSAPLELGFLYNVLTNTH